MSNRVASSSRVPQVAGWALHLPRRLCSPHGCPAHPAGPGFAALPAPLDSALLSGWTRLCRRQPVPGGQVKPELELPEVCGANSFGIVRSHKLAVYLENICVQSVHKVNVVFLFMRQRRDGHLSIYVHSFLSDSHL